MKIHIEFADSAFLRGLLFSRRKNKTLTIISTVMVIVSLVARSNDSRRRRGIINDSSIVSNVDEVFSLYGFCTDDLTKTTKCVRTYDNSGVVGPYSRRPLSI